MVAMNRKPPHYGMLPPADFDPGEPLQDAYNPADPNKGYSVKFAGVIQGPKGRRLREYVLLDKNANHWIAYLAICADREIYQWPNGREAYIKPSIIAAHKGFTADLFDKYRIQAFKAFDRIDAQIKAVRSIASQTAGKIILDASKLELPPAPSLVIQS
jgi:hypothetical protein